MLNTIRKLNTGWGAVLLGIIAISSGLSMTTNAQKGNTLLCFDAGYVYLKKEQQKRFLEKISLKYYHS